jgi:hypothetical protein
VSYWTIAFAIIALSAASLCRAEEYPVRGFPTGEEVLNRKVVRLPQPDPELAYRPNGFRAGLLSEVPPVGVHPRVVMSPSDIPRIRENIKRYAVAKKAWEDVLLKKIEPDKKEPTGHNWEGLYALVTGNDEYGRKSAAELVKRALETDRKIDEVDATHPYPHHWWFKIRGSGILNVAKGYDYLYGHMTDEQRAAVRKVISKATVGRYNHGMELPRSWRTWNWPHFSQNIVNAALAIEGEEGYEPRIYDVCRESVVDFLTYKISPGGYDHESTGYNAGLVWGGGGSESLIAVARRLRDPNPLTHPHLQNHADAFIGQQGGPDGPWFGRGDASGAPPGFVLLTIMKYFYPEDPRWDMLWQSAFHVTHWDGSPGRFRGVDNRTGGVLPFLLMYGVEARKGPDGKPVNWWTKDAPFSLTYTFPELGHLTTRTSWDAADSVHMTLSAITKMTNTGHDGPDEGTFSVWAHGVDWSRQGDKYNKYTPWRASIAIDGKGQYYGVAPGLFLPLVDAPQATAGVVDVTYSYTWHLRNGRYNVLYSPLFEEDPTFYTNQWSLDRVKTGLREEELDPTPFSREFWRFAGTNYGLWMGEDRHPTMRYLNTPVRRAFRSVDLVRGEHPYVLVIDDMQKDDEPHLYDWIMPLAARNEMVRKSGERDERAVELLVRRIPSLGKGEKDPGLRKGDPVLLVRVLNRNCNGYPSIRFVNEAGASDTSSGRQRIIVPSVSVAPDFKILIYPHRHGDPLPATTWNEARTRLTIEIGEQVDTVRFARTHVDRRPFGGVGEQTLYSILRGGEAIQTVGGAPSVPRFVEGSRDFAGEYECAFAEPAVGQEIRYTLNGTNPTADSPLYTAPINLELTTKVKAATFAPYWQYGPTRSEVVEATYAKARPAAPRVAEAELVPGVELSFYELPANIWKGAHVDLESPLMPDLDWERPVFVTRQKSLKLPRIQPRVAMREMFKGFYVFDTYFRADTPGRYRFSMRSCGPTRLAVGDKALIDVRGPYHCMLREREGEVYLAAGHHSMTALAADPAFFASHLRSVVPFELKVMPPGEGEWRAVAPGQLSRDRSVSFSIPGTSLEVGVPLDIVSDVAGAEVRYTTDGDAPTTRSPRVTGPLTWNEVGDVPLNVALFRNGERLGPVINKPLNVVARSAALAELPALEGGMIRARYLHPAARAKYGMSVKHDTGATGDVQYEYVGDRFDLAGVRPEDRLAVDEFLPDGTGGVIRTYEAYWKAPAFGTYEFDLPFGGANRLDVDGVRVTSNHVEDAQPMGKIMLEPGWHRLTMMYEASMPGVSVIGPGIERALTAADFMHPRTFDELRWNEDAAGRPASFLLGAWAMPGKVTRDVRLQSETFGATPTQDPDHPGAVRFDGERSLVLIKRPRQTSRELTFAAWIKPAKLDGTQVLLNRQKPVDNPYAQRGGFTFALAGDSFHLIHYWHHPPKFHRVKAGVWQHVALTVAADPKKGNTLLEFYLDGSKVHRFVHPHVMEVPCAYMELFGQADRRKTDPKTTAGLGRDDLSIINCFVGLAAEARLYDTALPMEAIRKLAGR